jgi:hypothetical protein
MPKTEALGFEAVIADAMIKAQNSAFEAAIDICRSMDGSCNQCCADAIERFRHAVCVQDNKALTLNS